MIDKKTIKIISAVVAGLILLCLGFFLFQNQRIRPGVKGLAKKNVGIFYCSYANDDVATVVGMIANAINAKPVEIRPDVPYSKDQKKFNERILKEQSNLTTVVLENNNINLLRYDYIIFATPVMNNEPCPTIQKFVIDSQDTVAKKPVSVLILYKKGESISNTLLFFTRKLALAVWKPPFITEMKNKKNLEYELNMWFNMMNFKRKDLRHK